MGRQASPNALSLVCAPVVVNNWVSKEPAARAVIISSIAVTFGGVLEDVGAIRARPHVALVLAKVIRRQAIYLAR